jgi:integrase-like protein
VSEGTGIYQRGRIWVVRYREGGRQRSQSFDKKADAEAFRIDRRRARQLGAHAPAEASPMPLKRWLETWMRREGPRWGAETRERRGELIDKWVIPYLGGVRLKDLGTERLAEYRAEILAAGASPDRANKALALLSAAFSVAARDRKLPANPCKGLGTLPSSPTRKRVLTPWRSSA